MKKLFVTIFLLSFTLFVFASNWNDKLFEAVKNGDLKTVEKAIKKGTDVNAKDKDGFTVLMKAAANGYKDICELLISKGADVNAKNKDGRTALDLAKEKNNKAIAELLISKGAADPMAKPTEKPPMELAKLNKNKKEEPKAETKEPIQVAQNVPKDSKKLSQDQGAGEVKKELTLTLKEYDEVGQVMQKLIEKKEVREVHLNVEPKAGNYVTQAEEWTISYEQGGPGNMFTKGVITNKYGIETSAEFFISMAVTNLAMETDQVDCTFLKIFTVIRPDDRSQTALIISDKVGAVFFTLNGNKRIVRTGFSAGDAKIDKTPRIDLDVGFDEYGGYIDVNVSDENARQKLADGKEARLVYSAVYPTNEDNPIARPRIRLPTVFVIVNGE